LVIVAVPIPITTINTLHTSACSYDSTIFGNKTSNSPTN